MSEKLELYSKNTRAWFKDPHEGYISCSLILNGSTNTNVKLTFKHDATGKELIYESLVSSLDKNRWEDLPPLKNPPHLEGF
jgi:hypothetical protein